MRIPTFSAAQQRHILEASAAILTEEGKLELSETGAATLRALQRYIFRSEAPSTYIRPVIPEGLPACFASEEQRQLGDTLFTVLPLIDEVTAPGKVAVSERALAAAELPALGCASLPRVPPSWGPTIPISSFASSSVAQARRAG